VAALLLLPGAARAACTVSVSSGLGFGSYDVFATTPLDSTGAVMLKCSGAYTSPVVVAMTRGSSAVFIPRTLKNGTQSLEYNIYGDSAHTLIWGDGSSGTVQCYVSYTGTYQLSIPVYGRVTAGQDVGAGNYSDTITVVVNY
jgi:spore coat protein U-like protein